MHDTPLVLVIEDDFDNQYVVKYFLEQSGFKVVTANNGKIGIDMCEVEMPDIILLDIMMPVMDGYQTVSYIRQNDRLKNIPVLCLTANAQSTEREKCLSYGCDEYIEKPLDLISLLDTINKFLNR